ncbi:MAG: hypothetical protein ACK47C_16245 [Paracoccaceae bacterium]
MQGRPLAHPAFAEYLAQLVQTPPAAPPMPPAARPGKELRA